METTHRRDLLDSEPSPGQPAGLRLDSEHQPKRSWPKPGTSSGASLTAGDHGSFNTAGRWRLGPPPGGGSIDRARNRPAGRVGGALCARAISAGLPEPSAAQARQRRAEGPLGACKTPLRSAEKRIDGQRRYRAKHAEQAERRFRRVLAAELYAIGRGGSIGRSLTGYG